jgi:hypothetical protein
VDGDVGDIYLFFSLRKFLLSLLDFNTNLLHILHIISPPLPTEPRSLLTFWLSPSVMAIIFLLFLLSGISIANDQAVCTLDSCYATEPNLPRPTTILGLDGKSSLLIPFAWDELSALATTTTIQTTITMTNEAALLITPTVEVIVQPLGYWCA